MWREARDMLRDAADLPAGREGLFTSLRRCYDTLDDKSRTMFLDAAFFFLGRREDTANNAWKRCG